MLATATVISVESTILKMQRLGMKPDVEAELCEHGDSKAHISVNIEIVRLTFQ